MMQDILERLAHSSATESSHELQCRCFDAAEEISRLRAALKKANEQTEHFEREWYLRGDALENLQVQAVRGVALGWVSVPVVEWDAIMMPNVELTGGALAPSSDRRERG